VRLVLLVSFDRVQRLAASLRWDSSRPSCPCLGYPQQVFEAGLIFDPSPDIPDSSTRGQPSNPSSGPVYDPSRFPLWCAPTISYWGRKSHGGSLSCPLEGDVTTLRRRGIRSVLSRGAIRPFGGAFTREVAMFAGSIR